ncbi:MAG: hypothetical protein VW268_09840 [Rhodospirillaceae bacterium]
MKPATNRKFAPLIAVAVVAAGLTGCETAKNAMDTVSEASHKLWDKLSSPFGGESDKSTAGRDPTRERREDVEQWEQIRGSDDPTKFQNFIQRYPDSALTHLARRRLATLQPTQGAQVPATHAGDKPALPALNQGTQANLPDLAPPGQFPAPWVLGRWAIDCSQARGGNGVTYSQMTDGRVRVLRDDGSAAIYEIRRENDILVLEGNGLIYQDRIVSVTELRSYAVKYNNQWHKVDLVYRKCN